MNGSQKAHESYLSGSQKRDTAERIRRCRDLERRSFPDISRTAIRRLCRSRAGAYGRHLWRSYPKGREPIYLCVNCNAYVGCYPDGRPMGKVANTVLRLKRQETHRIFDQFWKKQGWSRSAAYRWLARSLNIPEQDAHIGLMEMDECERVIRLCLTQPKKRKAA